LLPKKGEKNGPFCCGRENSTKKKKMSFWNARKKRNGLPDSGKGGNRRNLSYSEIGHREKKKSQFPHCPRMKKRGGEEKR